MKTSRRTKGEGSIIQLSNGKWRARIECEPVDGKRKWLSKTCDTKTEAIKALKVLERKQADATQVKEFKGDFANLVAAYLEHCKLKGTRESTLIRYNSGLKFWLELFKHKKVDKINVADINHGIQIQHQQQRALSTMHMELTVLSQVFNFAIDCTYISLNPVKKAAKPKKSAFKNKQGELKVISHEEHKLISNYLKERYIKEFVEKHSPTAPSRFYMIYNLTYVTGLRIGEVAALKWEDINEHTGTLSINKQLNIQNKIVPPKTERSVRTIAISREMLSKLKELKGYYEAQGFKSEFIFPRNSTDNKPFTTQTIRNAFNITIKALNINKPFTFHSIRHTHATELIENKIPITVVSERLGHASIMITLEIYAHPTPASRLRAASVCKIVT